MTKSVCTTCNRDDAMQAYDNGDYCHRCQINYPKKVKKETSLFPILEDLGLLSDEVVLPQSFTQEIPPEGLKWLYKHGITDNLIKQYKIVYVKNEVVQVPWTLLTTRLKNRIILPKLLMGPYGDWEGVGWYQARALDDMEPKYITIGPKSLFQGHRLYEGRPLVLTEDILSCIRVNNVGYNSFGLTGTNLSDSDLLTLKNTYDTIILWLDNDKAGIDGMNKLAKRFELHGTKVIKITNQEEPKRCFNQKIRDILKTALQS